MKRLSIYYNELYSSIIVENGAKRDVTASNMVEVLRSMHPDDLGVVTAFLPSGHHLRRFTGAKT